MTSYNPRAAESLSQAIRFPTVSRSDFKGVDVDSFRAFEEWLEIRYPLCHGAMRRERVGDWGLLYTWNGQAADADIAADARKPILFIAHYDVVPAPPEEQGWTKDPFAGEISEGFVWGRGALDIKLSIVAIMEAAEALLAQGFKPERTYCLAFGADEEVGGARGAGALGAELARRGMRFEYLVDEGAMIIEGALSFMKGPAALIGVAEKGHVNYEIVARGKSGHASMPPRKSAAGILCAACAALEARPFPARLTRSVAAFLKAAAKAAPFPLSLILGAPRLFWPLIVAAFSRSPSTDAMLRTTRAVTMLLASPKENILPDEARANVNVRPIAGETIASVKRRIERWLRRFGVEVRVARPEQANEALPESSAGTRAFKRIAALAAELAPGARALPFQVTVGTDTRHYLDVAENIYRITPALVSMAEVARVHSADERVSLDNIERCARFYEALFREA